MWQKKKNCLESVYPREPSWKEDPQPKCRDKVREKCLGIAAANTLERWVENSGKKLEEGSEAGHRV